MGRPAQDSHRRAATSGRGSTRRLRRSFRCDGHGCASRCGYRARSAADLRSQRGGGVNTWLLAEDRFVPSLVPSRESIYTIGNGYLSTRGSFEEDLGGEIRASFINGLYVSPPGELPLLGAVPDWTGVSITIDGVLFSLDGKIGGYQRNLDMRSGILEREVLWRGAETGVVKIRFRRLVSMAERHLAALELTFLALTEDSGLRLET